MKHKPEDWDGLTRKSYGEEMWKELPLAIRIRITELETRIRVLEEEYLNAPFVEPASVGGKS